MPKPIQPAKSKKPSASKKGKAAPRPDPVQQAKRMIDEIARRTER